MPFKDLEKIEGLEVIRDLPLAPMTTFRIGGPARIFLRPRTRKALEATMDFLAGRGIPYGVLGRGSNLLIHDRGLGVVLSLAALNRISAPPIEEGDCRLEERSVSAEAGCKLKTLLLWAMHHGLGGLEHLAGIPASVGGAIFMNAGTAPGCIGDVTEAVRLTGPWGSTWLEGEGLRFRYRGVTLPEGALVSGVRLRLTRKPWAQVLESMKARMALRKKTQPLGKFSAGCVFKNPAGDSAGRIIEACGLKGTRIGDAEISRTHANFIVNRGSASCIQVLDLMEIIRAKVLQETGVGLEPEVSMWGMETS